jgi:hypothetical protein
MTTYRLFDGVSGPSSPASYGGPFLAGVVFTVTTSSCWLEGYWWWVCPTGQSTVAQEFALWIAYSNVPNAGVVLGEATVKSADLTPGQWNYVPLAVPVPLTIGANYVAVTGFSGAFPIAPDSFGPGDPYADGIISGPLVAYSDVSGSLPQPYDIGQGVFSTSGDDPTAGMPVYADSQHSNFWLDVQVTTSPPAGTSYRLWPRLPVIAGSGGQPTDPPDTLEQSNGTEFWLSTACTLDNIWFWSPPASASELGTPGVQVLPDACAIWDVATQAVVAGTFNGSPAWSGPAGSGWVSCAYSGITLPAGKYKTSIWSAGGQVFFAEERYYFGNGGPAAANGIDAGPLYSPNLANATAPGNSSYQLGGPAQAGGVFPYPDTFDTGDQGENRWVDVEVTPVPPPAPRTGGPLLTFFP